MARTRSLFSALTRRGPHRVLRGDLAFAGIPGTVYTPAAGLHLPGVAFAHDWLTGAEHYTGTLEHLASWGIVAAAPDTHRGVAPSVLNLAYDLGSVLDVICGVRLGPGQISVNPSKLGVVGHGFGGAAAVFAAAGRGGADAVKAAAALFPAVTKPSARQASARLQVPGLVLAAPDDATSLRTEALEIADAWEGSVLRVVKKATPGEFPEKRHILRLVGLPGSSSATQRRVRALLTGFLLFELTGDKKYKEFADAEATLPSTAVPDPDAPPVTPEDRIVALFR